MPLLEQLRRAAVRRGDAAATAEMFVSSGRAFVLFHDKRLPNQMRLSEVIHLRAHIVKTAAPPRMALAQPAPPLLLHREVVSRDLGELPQPRPPHVVVQSRHGLHVRHYAPHTEDCYAG